jgi:hypothetical protein
MLQLQRMIDTNKRHWVNPDAVTNEQALGVIIAKYCQYDGARIVSALQYALEDANHHDLNRKIDALIHEEAF